MTDIRGKVRVAPRLTDAIVFLGAAILYACPPSMAAAASPAEQVLFVCEHGNVKSVMAAAYFNQLAAERNLPQRALSRGAASNPSAIPPPIVAGLWTEGIDVSDVKPLALTPRDLSAVSHVVAIGEAELPRAARQAGTRIERWTDVPSASANYSAARDSLRAHVRDLVERLSQPASE